MEEDHVHLYLAIPLNTGHIPDVLQKLKGVSSRRLGKMEDLKGYFKRFYRKEGVGKRARGYFVCTVGEVNDKLIKEYVENQGNQGNQIDHSLAMKAPSF